MSFDISVFLLRWDKKRLGAGRLFDKKPRGARHAHRGVGGEGETRTPAPVTRPTPLAGAPRHQLEYFSVGDVNNHLFQLLTVYITHTAKTLFLAES